MYNVESQIDQRNQVELTRQESSVKTFFHEIGNVKDDAKALVRRVIQYNEDIYSGKDAKGRTNCCRGCFAWWIFTVLFLLALIYGVQLNSKVMPSPNEDLIWTSTDGAEPDNYCKNLLQGIRSAYFENSGEYQCSNHPKATSIQGNNHVQCIETYLTIEFLFFNVDFQRKGACIDFQTQEAICYHGVTGGMYLGFGFAATYGMSIVCPNEISDISGKGMSVCMPSLTLMGANPWPVLCFDSNTIKNHHHKEAPKISTDDTVQERAGYSLEFGYAGVDISAILVALSWGNIEISAKKTIKDIDSGVKGFGFDRPPYSLEWFVFWIYVALGFFLCYEIFIKRRERFYKLCDRKFGLTVVQGTTVTGEKDGGAVMNTNFN